MRRVLVIDDDDEVRDLLRRVLERERFEVHEAADGREGLRHFREHGADLVIVDLFMPHKEGIETILEIREMSPTVKTIAISGGGLGGEMEFLDHARRFGALRTFAKPFDIEALLEAIHELVGPPAPPS